MQTRFPASPIALVLTAVVAVGGFAERAGAQFLEDVTIIHEWQGQSAGDRIGEVVRPVGDLDGDGVVDISISAQMFPEGGELAGKVFIYSGASGDLIRSHVGERPLDNLSWEVATVGDLNDDDVPEYLVSAPSFLQGRSNGPGRAFLYSGVDGALLHEWVGESFGDAFGYSLVGGGNTHEQNGIGDINGDLVPDILIGAPFHDANGNNSGRVYVYSGANFDELIHVIDGRAAGEWFGSGIGGLGDLNEDGFGDFVVGASQGGSSGRGRSYVLSGEDARALTPRLNADGTGDRFGLFFTSGPGDVNQDGTPDIFVTDFGNSARGRNTGRAYVFSGTNGAPIWTWTGTQSGEQLGIGRGCGDVNFDGYPDLLVSAYASSFVSANAGRSFVFSGKDGSILRSITNTRAGEFFGWSTVGVGDVNGDGAPDFLFGAPLSSPNGFRSGRVYLIAGIPQCVRSPEWQCDGDVDGDGQVNPVDSGLVQAAFGSVEDQDLCNFDIDCDGQINPVDSGIVQSLFGSCDPPRNLCP